MSQVTQRLVLSLARAVIDRYGIDASAWAAGRADQRRGLGDTEGEGIWRRVARAIDDLQSVDH